MPALCRSLRYNVYGWSFSLSALLVFLYIQSLAHVFQTTNNVVHKESSQSAPGLRPSLGCWDREAVPRFGQRGDFWVLYNYVRAEESPGCAESVTYTTHADHTFLENLAPLLRRWRGPVSVALFAPSSDWSSALQAVQHVRNCGPDAQLVRKWTTFHFYFPADHFPNRQIERPDDDNGHLPPVKCSETFATVAKLDAPTFRNRKSILYPVNVGRNIAREEANTHFVLASDIELYPSPHLIPKFLDLIQRQFSDSSFAIRPKVFPLSIFEVQKRATIPNNKTELVKMLDSGQAVVFHYKLCPHCHAVPNGSEWRNQTETDQLGVFQVSRRVGEFFRWEPIYIGQRSDPLYDERLTWEGKSDKMTQGYAMCVMDYEFHVLDNAFLVHSPGIKKNKRDKAREVFVRRTNALVKKKLIKEYATLYGNKTGCRMSWD